MPAIRILFLGDVVGEPGRKAVIEQLPLLKQSEGLDFCIVNGENSAGGKGITPRIAIDLLRAGAAVITTGDHVWDQQEIVDYFPTEPRLLRPLNYPEGTPGGGSGGVSPGRWAYCHSVESKVTPVARKMKRKGELIPLVTMARPSNSSATS